MKSVYIAGPMTGLPNFNYPSFHEAENSIMFSQGARVKVYNPAKLFEGETHHHWSEYMRGGLRMLLRCDSVVLLDGWKTSRGAVVEFIVAMAIGCEFYDNNLKPINISEQSKLWPMLTAIFNSKPPKGQKT